MMRVESLCRKSRATVGDPGMDARDLPAGLGAVLGTKLFLGETALRLGQLLFIVGKEAGIADLLATIEHDHIMQSQINARPGA